MAGSPGYREGIIADPNATWEKVQQGNIGLEAGLFNNRFNITAEYFHDKRTDIYMTNNRLSFLYGYDVGISENLGKHIHKAWNLPQDGTIKSVTGDI